MLVMERRQLEQRQQQAAGRRRIQYMHALGEASGLPDASQVRWQCIRPGPALCMCGAPARWPCCGQRTRGPWGGWKQLDMPPAPAVRSLCRTS
jgi:hypothetical protein